MTPDPKERFAASDPAEFVFHPPAAEEEGAAEEEPADDEDE